MVSDKQIKIIKSLKLKKNRIKHNLFVAEGDKTILELITAGFNINSLYSINRQIDGVKNSVIQLSKPELNKMTCFFFKGTLYFPFLTLSDLYSNST